jgi:hypothetical protein
MIIIIKQYLNRIKIGILVQIAIFLIVKNLESNDLVTINGERNRMMFMMHTLIFFSKKA